MRAEVTVGLTGMSVLLQDPTYAGFAPEAQTAALLSFTAIGGLAALTLWSERWRRRHRALLRTGSSAERDERLDLPDEAETAVHSTAI